MGDRMFARTGNEPEALAAMLADYRTRWHPNDLDLLFANRKGPPIGAQCVRRKVLYPIRERLGLPVAGFTLFATDTQPSCFQRAAPTQDSYEQHGRQRHQDHDALYPCHLKRPAGSRVTCDSSFFRRSAAHFNARSLNIN